MQGGIAAAGKVLSFLVTFVVAWYYNSAEDILVNELQAVPSLRKFFL